MNLIIKEDNEFNEFLEENIIKKELMTGIHSNHHCCVGYINLTGFLWFYYFIGGKK